MPDLDVVLFGPTGVTGREVARHLGRRARGLGLRWGVAGRDGARMRAALATVQAKADAILVADTSDQDSIDAVVRKTRVVANLVGPYARHGEPVYAACARHGVHQLDLTGEIDWVRTMIERYDDEATASGARIVPTAGFEGLPFDLGSLLAAHTLHERTGDRIVDVDAAVTMHATGRAGLDDTISGGTFQSGVEMIERGQASRLLDPYLLDPAGSTTTGRYDLRPRKHASGTWIGPMMPWPYINPPVIHRSAALLRDSGDPTFAPGFAYREGAATEGALPRSAAAPAAAFMSLVSAGMGLTMRLPDGPRRSVAGFLGRTGPQSGDGPAVERLDDWSYRIDLRATDIRGAHQDAVVEADGHPGYKSTATMIGEAALLLADPDAGLPDGSGFLTPATALGLGVLDRFGAAGLRFSIA